MSRPIEISKPILGQPVVGYGCPHCDTFLKSPVDDIGKHDFCPDCNRQFVVPGAKEWQRYLDEQKADQERKAIAQQEEKRAKQLRHEQAQEEKAAREKAKLEKKQQEIQRQLENRVWEDQLPLLQAPKPSSIQQASRSNTSPGIQQAPSTTPAPPSIIPAQNTAVRQCPFCAETIQATAIKCKHCGEFLDGRTRSQTTHVVHSQKAPPPQTVYVKQPAQDGCGCSLIITIALGIVLAVIILMLL